ncbi:deoxyribodipyrimidine photo-lyase [Undibacterium pigrum]|uniref:deoxyribodipyrimidine photo-lyase n=1 Tax=Undibacterium pigrum TaxID=401470 RepID=UPI000D76BE1A|nr:deoxyribodipyrimidine photo-lyase [Undibacterium pigrum]
MNIDLQNPGTQGTIIYWFRNDLRIEDNQALIDACQNAEKILFVYCHSPSTLHAPPWPRMVLLML